jgi:hypothetical protein
VLVVDGVPVATWRLDSPPHPDIGVVNRLARWQLAARRLGWSIRLRNPCPELRDLLDFAGLGDVIAEGEDEG